MISKKKEKKRAALHAQNGPPHVQKFELSKKSHPSIPVSTTKILGDFSRDAPPEYPDSARRARYAELQGYTETVEQLRKWEKSREKSTFVKVLLRGVFWRGTKIRMPSEQKLYQAVQHYFPPRMELKVIVCDFGDNRAERRDICLGDIEKEFEGKPKWSQVRWIHAPLGIGFLHSSVEALFFHTGSKVMGRPFTRAGRAGWPFLETETLDLRSTRSVQDARDLLRILKSESNFNQSLDRGVFSGDNNKNLKKDVTWRSEYVGKPLNFWELAEPDLPWQVTDGSHLNMNGPSEGLRATKLKSEDHTLTRHAFYKDSYIARKPFRCFHRDDGFLLTMSPATGIDYLNTNLPLYLLKSQEELIHDHFASTLAQIYAEFSETGTSTWRVKNAEWFLIYLITEVGTAPHNIRQGYSVPSLMDAYDAIVHELKERRYDRWQRNETINLVRAYLVCMDELKTLGEIFSKKLDFFQRLRRDFDNFKTQDVNISVDNEAGETPEQRLDFAEHAMEECKNQCKALDADLRDSLNTLFQLRSIEQNELAIIADTQNKAIFVFTGVTIVFLPLSFFTSYYGMNLKGIMDTDKTETDFWKICGSSALAIVFIVCLYAFRYHIRQTMWAYRTSARRTLPI